MNGFAGCVPRFIKNHAGWILTILGCFGVVGTAVLAAEEAPIVQNDIEAEQNDRVLKEYAKHPEYGTREMTMEEIDDISAVGELTFSEKLKIALPIYLPAILVGGVPMGCMIGAQVFNMKQQAMLVGAYAMLSQQSDQYRKEVRDEVGEEKEKALFKASQQKVRELQAQVKKLEAENAPQLYGLAMLPGVIFESRPEHINDVFHHMLFNCLNCGGISLEEFYSHIGLPKDVYDRDIAAEYGWEVYENEITYGNGAVEFSIVDVERSDGKIVHVIYTDVLPYKLGMDYGMTDSSTDYMYEGYDCERAMFLAQASVDSDVEKFEQPDLWIQHAW